MSLYFFNSQSNSIISTQEIDTTKKIRSYPKKSIIHLSFIYLIKKIFTLKC